MHLLLQDFSGFKSHDFYDVLFASATKNPYKICLIRVTLSPVKKKEEVLW